MIIEEQILQKITFQKHFPAIIETPQTWYPIIYDCVCKIQDAVPKGWRVEYCQIKKKWHKDLRIYLEFFDENGEYQFNPDIVNQIIREAEIQVVHLVE
jgi:hypothetical protein